MKKIISLLLCLTLIFGMVVTTQAANELENAKSYTMNTSRSGSFTNSNQAVYYKFTLNNPGRVDIDMFADMYCISMKIYDAAGSQLWYDYDNWNSITEEINYQNSVYLNKGTYYFVVYDNNYRGNYTFTLTKNSVYESFSEKQGGSNNSTKTASPISLKKTYTGCITRNDDCDIYKFTLSKTGFFEFNLSSEVERFKVNLYDSKGSQLWSVYPEWNETTGEISYRKIANLCQGDYYLAVSQCSNYGGYTFDLQHQSYGESFAEPQGGSDNKLKSANSISINQKYIGVLATGDDTDFYKINVYDSPISLNVSTGMGCISLKLYNKSGNQVWYANPICNENTERIEVEYGLSLADGEYYLAVLENTWDRWTGKYTFYFTDGGYVSDPLPQLEPGQRAVYAPDGRIQIINKSAVKDWEKVGWYSFPVATMYSLDGKTKVINKADVKAWESVGWYTYPCTQVYAPNGKTAVIAKDKVDDWLAVGWYKVPVTTLYSPSGKTAVVAKSDVSSWVKVGWYKVPVVTLRAPDGRTAVVAKSEAAAWRSVGWK